MNTIKYSGTNETNALNKGNWYIGVGDVNKGPTEVTGYYAGITPPENGYTIYLSKETQGPAILVCADDNKLIETTNRIANSSYTTVIECFNYFATQDDKMVVNQDYEPIVTDGLVVNFDASYLPSYPKNGTTWYDLSGNGSNGTLINDPTFYADYGGRLQLDGSDDYINIPVWDNSSTVYTIEMWARWRSGIGDMFVGFTTYDIWTGSGHLGFNTGAGDVYGISSTKVNELNLVGTEQSNWHHYIFEFTNQVQNNKIYIDGVEQVLSQQQNTTNLTAIRSFSSSFKIGSWNNYDSFTFNGDVSIFRIYNRSLTSSEIIQNYNATKGRFGIQ